MPQEQFFEENNAVETSVVVTVMAAEHCMWLLQLYCVVCSTSGGVHVVHSTSHDSKNATNFKIIITSVCDKP